MKEDDDFFRRYIKNISFEKYFNISFLLLNRLLTQFLPNKGINLCLSDLADPFLPNTNIFQKWCLASWFKSQRCSLNKKL